jgi:Fe-S-cluster-containing dehydrogenase component/anaerobic selenocysteine-containing dehydrogenase
MPPLAAPEQSELGRRELMQLMGASAVMAGLAGCTRRPRDQILPYSKSPAGLLPGVPTHYATSFVLDGFATGVLARSDDGRPTKIEGNPEHPASLGATRPFEQASVLDLYDPKRLHAPRTTRAPLTWPQALRDLVARASQGAPPWFVLHPQSSPTLAALCDRVREQLPGVRFSFASPVARDRVYAASSSLFGRAVEAQYDFSRVNVVLDVASDFLASMPMSLRWARDFALPRRTVEPGQATNRLYSIETMPSPTGSLADHRLALRPSQIGRLLACLLGEVLAQGRGLQLPSSLPSLPRADASPEPAWVRAAATDLLGARGMSAVVIGERQPVDCQILAQLLNVALENLGRSVTFTAPAAIAERAGESLRDLVAAIQAGQVGSVFILEPNLLHTSPPELELERWLQRVPHRVHLTSSINETSHVCQWLLPLSHYLESWGDARGYDGTLSFVQPLIEPLYASRSSIELLAAFAGQPHVTGHELLEASWRSRAGHDFEHQRDAHLRLGFEPNSGFHQLDVTASWDALAPAIDRALAAPSASGLELNLAPSPALYDGRFGDNAWLQELPHPITKQTWGNAALIGRRTAAEQGIESSQLVEVTVRGRKLQLPALVQPGHAEGALTIELGYGQQGRGLARGIGSSGYALAGADEQQLLAQLKPLEARHALAITQRDFHADARQVGLSLTLAQYHAGRSPLSERRRQLSLLPPDDYRGTQWAMTIDTTVCTGCSSCVVACQAENNIPVVGRREVERGHEMHWLRIDRYHVGAAEQPHVVNQPMLCQHCEKAPCEYVCPVNATVHSPDGMNEMVYNRCIGTRFCSNNCPYKVRRFNWFKYTGSAATVRMARNPAVTVRERGVMEKCTFCVQRVRSAEVRARTENRALAEGEVVTACQQACPTGAIQFGSLEHRNAPVVVWRNVLRRYEALYELGTLPRVQYLAKVRNENPSLKEPG